MKKRITAISLVLASASGCMFGDSGSLESDVVETARQRETTTLTQSMAYPIVRKIENGTIVDDIDPSTNKARKAWDVSYSEMLIADEYAKCVAEQAGTSVPEFIKSSEEYPKMTDTGLSLLRTSAAIDSGACPVGGDDDPTKFPPTALEWLRRRTTPSCNVDPVTGSKAAAWNLPAMDSDSPVAAFAANPEVPDTAWNHREDTWNVRRYSYQTLYESHVGLCFAERLNQLLESADAFTITTEEHMLLLGLVRERSQGAMLTLGHILKYLNKDNSDIPNDAHAGPTNGAYLYDWLETNQRFIKPLRNKFFEAVYLNMSAAVAFATFLERQAGARWTTDDSGTAFGRDWAIGSARNRLMSLVFGGAPLGDLWGTDDTSVGAEARDWFSKVREGTEDPRVQVMFNLARAADALYMHPVTDSSGATTLDEGSWAVMYLETELAARVAACLEQDPSKCTAAALRPTLPATTASDQFMLKSVYGITLEHAKKLALMLYDSAIQHDMVSSASFVPTAGTFHLSGAHSATTPPDPPWSGQTGWFKLNSTTAPFQYALGERSQWGKAICSPRDENWVWFAACTGLSGIGTESHPEYIGALPALAFAREVLFELGPSTTADDERSMLASTLASMERLTGKTTVLRRRESIDAMMPIAVATASGPTLINPAVAGKDSGLKAAAIDPTYVGPNGNGRATLDTATPVDPIDELGSGAAAGLALASWQRSDSWSGPSSLLLKWTGTDATRYTFLSESLYVQGVEPTAAVTSDGWFWDLIQKSTAVSSMDWSSPAYDGFGLPKRWVPPADASLMGGSAGEESYTYLLKSAKSAAEDATAAVKTAIDSLSAEAQDELALSNAETKAKAIGAQEKQALCGDAGCDVSYVQVDFTLPNYQQVCINVPDQNNGKEACRHAVDSYASALHKSMLPKEAGECLTLNSPGLQKDGSERDRIILRIWNAARLVLGARDQAQELAVAAGDETIAVWDADSAAQQAKSASDAHLVELEAEYGQQVSTMRDRLELAKLQLDDAKWKTECFCITASDNSFLRGKGLGGNDTGAGANSRCFDAWVQFEDARHNYEVIGASTSKEIQELPAGSITKAMLNDIAAQKTSAEAQLCAASAQRTARLRSDAVQSGAHLAVLDQTTGELDSALAELRQLQLKAGQSEARTDLDVALANSVNDTNAGLRRKFRSYDLWRSRALLENARRLAVSARRAIEARFVVDLSALNADQAFVASPATWADEVYESDLNAPEVVGLSQAPKISGAIYPNKLLDYVGNLERFVQGYPMSYPTSLSLPDTEIITLSGPDQAETSAGTSTSLSADSQGWRFYCADQKTWISHPGVGQFPLKDRLSTACNGAPPALARLGFWLGPWGTLNGSWTRPVYADRHNVRWRRLAVNLVGTGIRDCAKASDSMSCYTNPFVRFNMVHAGPSWQTNYSGEWRALDVTTAGIEGGKALAAEEWMEPVSNSWNQPYVANVARGELYGRPAAGNYELVIEVTPDVRLDRIERVQLLVEQDYWVRQSNGNGLYNVGDLPEGSGGKTGAGGSSGVGGATGSGGASASTTAAGGVGNTSSTVASGGSSATGTSPTSGGTTGSTSSSNGGSAGAAGTTAVNLVGSCTATGSDIRLADLENGARISVTFDQRLLCWYAFHAGTTCTAIPATSEAFVPVTPSVSNGSLYVASASGSNCTASNWQGGGIGFQLLSSYQSGVETICPNYNASMYKGIAFDARGSGEIRIEVCTSDAGTGTDVDCHGAYFTISNTWTRYTALFNSLTQNGWGTSVNFNSAHLRKVQFLSKSASYGFMIDNVSFTN
jgi:hypothetical protein